VVQEIPPRAPEALVGDLLGEEVLKPLVVVVQAQLKVTPNRSVSVRTLMLALDVVVVPDEHLELLSAWARRDRHGHSFAMATPPVIGTDP
jgi:hypothetical protein